jgi:hypothetical protein
MKNKQQNVFCEIQKSRKKCTLNYCDTNGCMERKRVLVEPDRMENITVLKNQGGNK